MLENYPYITLPILSNEIKTDIEALLISNNKHKTLIHEKAVAETNVKIASQAGLGSGGAAPILFVCIRWPKAVAGGGLTCLSGINFTGLRVSVETLDVKEGLQN